MDIYTVIHYKSGIITIKLPTLRGGHANSFHEEIVMVVEKAYEEGKVHDSPVWQKGGAKESLPRGQHSQRPSHQGM